MLDPAIQQFLNECEEVALKKKIKTNTTEEEKNEFTKQAKADYLFENWLPSMLEVAEQHYVTHPAKFSHSKARTNPVIAHFDFCPDGFLKSGNSPSHIDLSNYANNGEATKLYKFLGLKLIDGKSVLAHLKDDTSYISNQLQIDGIDYYSIRNTLLPANNSKSSQVSSSKLKQVFFPVEKKYHLLSILTPSGLMFELKNRINDILFSKNKATGIAAKANGKYHPADFSDIYQLTKIGFGGDNKQNVSVLNNQNGGTAYLLPSIPPELSKRTIQPPRTSFFSDSLWINSFKDDFHKLHDQLTVDANTIHIRTRRDWIIRSIVYQVADQLWKIRHLDPGWSGSDNYQRLPLHQKIWLDQLYKESREDDLHWFDTVQNELARWFQKAYSKLLGKKALALGDEQLLHIKTVIGGCEGALK